MQQAVLYALARHRIPLFLRVLAAGLSFIAISALAQTATTSNLLLQPQERDRIAREVVENPDLKPLTAQGRLRVISVIPYNPPKEEAPAAGTSAVSITIFSYGEGRAYRVLYDPTTKRIMNRELLPGRPQPSMEERKEVYGLIRSEPGHTGLLLAGNVLEGGFVVDGPPGSSERDRFVQVYVLSPDLHSFVRVVTVDLTTAKIVSSVTKE
ncbi:MAG: hypothetical protein ACRD2S_02940 [Terriglobales bacterium]